MTTAARREGARLKVWLSRSETRDWEHGERAEILKDMAKRARLRGRRFYQVFGTGGVSLHVGEVAP